MLGISITSVGLVATLILGTSGLVMNPVHRRHVLSVRQLVVVPDSLPRSLVTERRIARQKRCLQHISSDSPASTSVAVNHAPVNVAPAPTQGSTPTSSSEPVQQAQPTPDTSGGSSADTFHGQLTFYDVGLGACGITNDNTQMVAAASMQLFDGFQGYTGANPNNNPICGKKAVITYGNQPPITVTIIDRCVGCAHDDLDLSPSAFDAVASRDLGRLSGASWHFVS